MCCCLLAWVQSTLVQRPETSDITLQRAYLCMCVAGQAMTYAAVLNLLALLCCAELDRFRVWRLCV